MSLPAQGLLNRLTRANLHPLRMPETVFTSEDSGSRFLSA